MRIGLLSTHHCPVLGYYIQNILNVELPISAILMDAKDTSALTNKLHFERTADRMPPISLETFEEHKIPVYHVKNHNNKTSVETIRKLQLDVLVNAGTPRILKKSIIDATPFGVLNCHPGLLPNFRGCTCVEWAVHLDERIGNTAHFMTEGIDEGPVIALQELDFLKSDRYVDVRVKVYQAGFQLMAETLKKLNDKTIMPENYAVQESGRYFQPISDEQLNKVRKKLELSEYKYQY